MRPTEVFRVPIGVGLALLDLVFTLGSIIEKFVEEFYGENLDIVNFFENWNVYMRSFSDIQENTI